MANDHRSIEFKRVIDNFNFLMTDMLKAPHDGVEEYKLYQERIALKQAEEWNKHGRFEFAARIVQRYARRRLARIRVKAIKSSEEYRLRMKRKLVGGAMTNHDDDYDDDNDQLEEKEESTYTGTSLPPGVVQSGEESSLPPGILSGDESSLPPGIVSDEESALPPGILSDEESKLPPGILSGEESSLPPGILSSEENIFDIGKEDSSDSDYEEDNGQTQRASGVERWERHEDEQGNVYYYDVETGESQWEVPDEMLMRSESMTMTEQPKRKSIWERHEDENGQEYWYNIETGQSQWETPAEMKIEEDEVEVRPSSNGMPVLLDNWEECTDSNGQTYYYNTITAESQWELPVRGLNTKIKLLKAVSMREENRMSSSSAKTAPSLPEYWEICHDEEENTYYYNSNTGESQWEYPV